MQQVIGRAQRPGSTVRSVHLCSMSVNYELTLTIKVFRWPRTSIVQLALCFPDLRLRGYRRDLLEGRDGGDLDICFERAAIVQPSQTWSVGSRHAPAAGEPSLGARQLRGRSTDLDTMLHEDLRAWCGWAVRGQIPRWVRLVYSDEGGVIYQCSNKVLEVTEVDHDVWRGVQRLDQEGDEAVSTWLPLG